MSSAGAYINFSLNSARKPERSPRVRLALSDWRAAAEPVGMGTQACVPGGAPPLCCHCYRTAFESPGGRRSVQHPPPTGGGRDHEPACSQVWGVRKMKCEDNRH